MHFAIDVTRKRLVLFVVPLAILAAAGAAYATIPDSSGVYTACKLNVTGTIRLIDPSLGSTSLLGHCTSLETQITWNQRGQNGVSPTVAQLQPGDSHCPAGGASLTDASGNVAYVCNGQNGADGKSFTGSFTSPSGQFSLTVSDGGVDIAGPGSSIAMSQTGDVTINAGNVTETVAKNESISVGADRSVTVGRDETHHVGRDRTERVDGNETVTVHANRTESVDGNETVKVGGDRTQTVSGGETITVGADRTESVGANETVTVGGSRSVHAGGTLDLTGSLVTINGGNGCLGAARITDLVSSTQILTGSSTVCIGG